MSEIHHDWKTKEARRVAPFLPDSLKVGDHNGTITVVNSMGVFYGYMQGFKPEMAREVVRRYNAHVALVTALERFEQWPSVKEILNEVRL